MRSIRINVTFVLLLLVVPVVCAAQLTFVPLRGAVHSIVPLDADRALVVGHHGDSVYSTNGSIRYQINVVSVYVVYRHGRVDTAFRIANTKNEYEVGSQAASTSSEGGDVFVSVDDLTDTGFWPAGTLQYRIVEDSIRWHPTVKDVVLMCSADTAVAAIIDRGCTFPSHDLRSAYDLTAEKELQTDPLNSVSVLCSTLSSALCADGDGNAWFVSNCGVDTVSIADTATYAYTADRISGAFIRREREAVGNSRFDVSLDGGRTWSPVEVPSGIRYTTVLRDGTVIGESIDVARQRSILHVLPRGSSMWSAAYATPDSMMIDTLHGPRASDVVMAMSKGGYRSANYRQGSLVCFADLTKTTSIEEQERPQDVSSPRQWWIVNLLGVTVRQGHGVPDTSDLVSGSYLVISDGRVQKIMR
jgi:hypothetical protein